MTSTTLLLFFLLKEVCYAQYAGDVEICTKAGTTLEVRGTNQLRRLLRDYPLTPYLFTRKIVIQSDAIPHSHPVLTLNTKYLDNDIAQLSTFLHEQLHWFLSDYVTQDRVDLAIAELRILFPNAPDSLPEGASDSRSTYEHLIVCAMEFEALSSIVGRVRAHNQLSEWQHYTWIYRTVLNETPKILNAISAADIALVSSNPSH